MNEDILYALASVAVTFAGFSGVVVVFPLRDAPKWLPTEIRMLRLLVADSLIVLFLALLPIVLSLGSWSEDAIWHTCNALLGSWFLIGDILAVRGEVRDRAETSSGPEPLKDPIRYGIYVVALLMGLFLWLGVLSPLILAGQMLYVIGLMLLLAFAAAEFLFFINLLLLRGKDA